MKILYLLNIYKTVYPRTIIHKFFILFSILGLLFAVPGFSRSVSKYELYVGQSEGSYMNRLEILPNGQIIDTGQNYKIGYLMEGIKAYPTQPWIMVSANSSLFTFQMNGDGTLYLKNSTILNSPYGYDALIFNQWITPNGELVFLVVDDSTYNRVYSVDSNGNLTDTGNRWYGSFYAAVDPLGRIMINDVSADTPAGNNIYRIDYVNKQLIKTQVLSWTTAQYWSYGGRGMLFSPDGKMAFYWGALEYAYDNFDNLRVFDIDSAGSVSMAQRFSNPADDPTGGAITPDGQYFYLNSGGPDSTMLFQVDSAHNKLIDTGKRLSVPPGVEVWDYRISPDGKFALILYYDSVYLKQTLTTAYILGDGTLAWTGYTFPFELTYGPIGDRLIIPIYTTDVPYELWKTLDDDK